MADAQLKSRLESALRGTFSGPFDQVLVRDGYAENVHVLVVSPSFKGTPEYLRHDRVWEVLARALSLAELALVSLILAFDVDEPEYEWALREYQAAS